jgi:hypothetical protein
MFTPEVLAKPTWCYAHRLQDPSISMKCLVIYVTICRIYVYAPCTQASLLPDPSRVF